MRRRRSLRFPGERAVAPHPATRPGEVALRAEVRLGFGLMNKLFGILLLGGLALANANCSDDGSDTTTSSGSGSGSFSCDSACDTALALMCPNDTKTECVNECSDSLSKSGECSAQFQAAFACASQHLQCGSDGTAQIDEAKILTTCGVEFFAMEGCAACQLNTDDDACDQCKATKCCNVAKTLFEDPSLPAAFACIAACSENDDACFTACTTKYPDFVKNQQALGACEEMQCGTECGPQQ